MYVYCRDPTTFAASEQPVKSVFPSFLYIPAPHILVHILSPSYSRPTSFSAVSVHTTLTYVVQLFQ